MSKRLFLVLAILTMPFTLQGCAAAIGAGAVVVADEVLEDRDGDDGLF